jgi:hypothetical protein
MYDVFDSFLAIDTWHTLQPADQERFFCALRKVINNRNFSPDGLAEHFDRSPARKSLDEDAYLHARDYYVAAAAVVKRYLVARCP